jgi:hypothetical protein
MRKENAGEIIYRLVNERKGLLEAIRQLCDDTRKETGGTEANPELLRRLGQEDEKALKEKAIREEARKVEK